jgi:hypothetical protein
MATKKSCVPALMTALKEFEQLKAEGDAVASVKAEWRAILAESKQNVGQSADHTRQEYLALESLVSQIERSTSHFLHGGHRTIDCPDPSSEDMGGSLQLGTNSSAEANGMDLLNRLVDSQSAQGGDCLSLRPGVYRHPLRMDGRLRTAPHLPIIIQGHRSHRSLVSIHPNAGEEAEGEDDEAAEEGGTPSMEVPVVTISGHRKVILRDMTLIQASHSAAPVIRIDGDDVEVYLERVTIVSGFGDGIVCNSASKVFLHDCTLEGPDVDPSSSSLPSPIHAKPQVQQQEKPRTGAVGLKMKHVRELKVTESTLSQFGQGVTLESVCGTVSFSKCRVSDCAIGSAIRCKEGSVGLLQVQDCRIERCAAHSINVEGKSRWQLCAERLSFDGCRLGNVFIGGLMVEKPSRLEDCDFGPCLMSSLTIIVGPQHQKVAAAASGAASGFSSLDPTATTENSSLCFGFLQLTRNRFTSWQHYAVLVFIGGGSNIYLRDGLVSPLDGPIEISSRDSERSTKSTSSAHQPSIQQRLQAHLEANGNVFTLPENLSAVESPQFIRVVERGTAE